MKRERWTHLAPESRAVIRKLIAAHGESRAATVLGISLGSVVKLAGLGYGSKPLIEKVEAKLAEGGVS